KHPAVRLLAISDRDPARARALAQAAGADSHSGSNDDVIDHPEVSAIIVSTPEQQHTAPILRGLELGKPVLVEKPIGFSLTEADTILTLCTRPRAIFASATAAATRTASCAPRSRCATDGSAGSSAAPHASII